jgi:TolB protein
MIIEKKSRPIYCLSRTAKTRRTIWQLSALILMPLLGCASSPTDKNLAGQNTHPVWSPDGTKIAFLSNRDGVLNDNEINFEIYLMDANGSNELRLTENTDFDADIVWSPDGKRIAFKSYRDKNDEIYVMSANGAHQTNVTDHPAADHAPSWSPDGTKIAFNSDRSGNHEIYMMNPEGSDIRQLTEHDSSDSGPVWSPEGQRIAFVSGRDGNDEIYVMNADGSNSKRLTHAPKSDWYPIWSPDGSHRDLLTDQSDSGNVAWSPDGRKIAFGSERDGHGEIYVMRTDGSEQRRLTVR